ncbi:hypothetical protein JCGZ_14609 [Jatropha curcas]|uniref:SWIM-type domain-containing protein n=1 Tax=Jatropha curcas TaxID=180498 RepID=A0A067K1D1_JATCU|nr:uncharacterized protein LOC105643205 [Jatropha curcas]KDP28838.1 hypothetical protein JCGZ_14609 [Jatropha curcas]
MARWDEILSLPVQNPPTLEFSATDLVWSKIEGWRDKIDRLALIPFARVDDFVRGESANKECPTRFHVEARRRRPSETSYKQKVDGILEYILYWCSFGPDDHRKGGIVRPSRSVYVPKKKNAGRPNTKRGCTCHFIVKRLIAEPSVALIIYNQDKHVDKKGLPCHGPQDKKAEGTRAMFAPYISEDLRLRVLSLLYVGVSVETIMQRHNESVEKQGGPCNRDDLLTHRYVRRQERSIRRSTYELDMDDAVSISLWVECHQNNVFFYEDFSDSDPLTLGIQTEWQLQQMIRFGNFSLLASDSRFGTNKLKYPVHSLVVFNSDKKAIPVAWIMTPRFATADAHKWMRALYNRVCTKDPTFKLAGFIVDDPSTDILTIRDVFQCPVLISFWRVRQAWHKNLLRRCSEIQMRAQIWKRLGEAIDDICRGPGSVDLFEVFMEDFVDCSDFMDYFKAVWYPRLGLWTHALKNFPLASQETSAAIELYHNQLKVRLLNEKDPSVYQRADWLVDKLGTKVHSYFWLDEYSEKDEFARYWKDEWDSGLTAWRKALKIPDLDVVMEGRCARVADQLDRDRFHVVWNPRSNFALCDCSWAEMGNLCEHVFKVIRMSSNKGYRKPSISLSQYNQALIDMLHCPPHDSLIRDHAVSLAVTVQKQLDAMAVLDSSNSTAYPIQKQAVEILEQQTGDADGRHLMDKDVSFHNTDDCGDRHEVSGGGVAGDSAEPIGEKTTCAEMDVDQSSNCIPVDEVVINDVFMENRDDSIKGPTLKDDALTDQIELENDSVADTELPSVDIPTSLVDFMGKCATNCDDVGDNGSEPLVITNTADADNTSDKASVFLANSVEPQVIGMVATSGAVENTVTEPESDNGSNADNHYPTDNVSSLNRLDDKETHNPDLSSVGRMIMSESQLNCLSTSSNSGKPHHMELTSQETNSHEKPSLRDKLSLISHTHQTDVANGKSDISQLDATNGIVPEGTASAPYSKQRV